MSTRNGTSRSDALTKPSNRGGTMGAVAGLDWAAEKHDVLIGRRDARIAQLSHAGQCHKNPPDAQGNATLKAHTGFAP